MPLAGLTFLFLFFPVSLLLSSLLPEGLRKPALLVCSLVFYAWGDPSNLLLLPVLAYIAYLTARQTMLCAGEKRVRRGITGVGIGLCLLSLVLFKFAAELFSALPVGGKVFALGVDVPVGFSFFVMRMIGYQVDVYRGRGEAARSFPEFLGYALFFPLMTAGPLVPFSRWRKRAECPGGLKLLVTGLAQKLLLADTAYALFRRTLQTDRGELPVLMAWMALLLGFYAVYYEFSAFLRMGAGLCRLLGVSASPMVAGPFSGSTLGRCIQGFHGSLSRWFSLYLYRPLAGLGMPSFLAVLLTGIAAGLLFGGRLTCLLFGCFIGLACLSELLLAKKFERGGAVFLRVFTPVLLPLGVSLLLFQSLPDWLDFLGALFGLADNPFFSSYTLAFFRTALPLLAGCILFSVQSLRRLLKRGAEKFALPFRVLAAAGMVLLFGVCLLFLAENGSSAFLYLRL